MQMPPSIFLTGNNPLWRLAHIYDLSQCIMGVLYIHKQGEDSSIDHPSTVHPTEKGEHD